VRDHSLDRGVPPAAGPDARATGTLALAVAPSNTQSNRDRVRLRGPAKSSAALALHRRTAIVAAASSRTPPESCFSAFSTLNQLCAQRRISESNSFRRSSRCRAKSRRKPASPGDPLRFADAEHRVKTQHVRRAEKESVRHAARHAARFLTRTVSDQLSPGAMWGRGRHPVPAQLNRALPGPRVPRPLEPGASPVQADTVRYRPTPGPVRPEAAAVACAQIGPEFGWPSRLVQVLDNRPVTSELPITSRPR
jgi:hypothetical protein